MMLFDAHAELEKIQKSKVTSATFATLATQSPENRPHVANVADVAVPTCENRKFARAPEKPAFQPSGDNGTQSDRAFQIAGKGDDPFRHRASPGGRPRTWTGRIVSLDEWRQLSEWDRHGPDGKFFNGLTEQWELPE